MAKGKLRKSDWLPAIIFIYFIAMTVIFGADMLKRGDQLTFWLTVGAELIVLVLLRIFLRKREKIDEKYK